MIMTDLHDNLGWFIGGILAAIAAFLGWFYESGLLNTIVGITIGAGIAFFVQTKTQKRAWKREYAIKVVEEIYAPLFKEFKNIVISLEKKHYSGQWFVGWSDIQDSHKYLMIDESFRTRMDKLNEALNEYSRAIREVRGKIAPKIFGEEARRVFELEKNIRTQLTIKASNTSIGLGESVIDYMLKGRHPKEVFKDDPEFKNVESYGLETEEGKTFHTHNLEMFDAFWLSCIARIMENPTFQFAIKENERLLADAKKLKEELAKRIQEPWNI